MEIKQILCILLVFLSGFFELCKGYKYYVGGKDGWILDPSEDYNHWAGRNRFQINDTLFFRYKKGSNSVLVVSKDDYNKCNKKNFIMKLEDGDSIFKFDRSGPFYFISGYNHNCENGQKLIVVVLALRHSHPKTPSPAPFTPSFAPEPAMSPESPSPSPIGHIPTLSPVPSPAPESLSPVTEGPGTSPPAQSGNSTEPAKSPGSAPGTGDVTKTPPPTPANSGSPAVATSKVLVLSVTILISVAITWFTATF